MLNDEYNIYKLFCPTLAAHSRPFSTFFGGYAILFVDRNHILGKSSGRFGKKFSVRKPGQVAMEESNRRTFLMTSLAAPAMGLAFPAFANSGELTPATTSLANSD